MNHAAGGAHNFIPLCTSIGTRQRCSARQASLTKRQLLKELTAMRRRVNELEQAEAERKLAEESLLESEERYRTVVEHSNDGVALVSAGEHIYVNRKFLEMFGYEKSEEIEGKPHSLTVHPDDVETVVKYDRKRRKGEPVPSKYEVRGVRKDGTLIFVEISAAVARFLGQPVTLAYFRDVTHRRRLEEKLRTMSIMDELTGLYNRRGFFTLCQHQLKLAERTTKDILLLFADLDNMKSINDTLGHQAGDRVLIETADILRDTFRGSDIIGRMGGDEFAVLAFGAPDATSEVLTARLQHNIDVLNKRGDRDYRISLSVGLVRYDSRNPYSLNELLSRADTLMYEHKRQKRG